MGDVRLTLYNIFDVLHFSKKCKFLLTSAKINEIEMPSLTPLAFLVGEILGGSKWTHPPLNPISNGG